MSTRYQKLASNEEDDDHTPLHTTQGSSASTQQRTDLEDSFGESFDDDDYNHQDTDRLLPQSTQANTLHSPSSSSTSIIPPSSHQQHRNAPAILPVSTDGVFANISAKPESDSNKLEETPPTYEEAAADATPPYWQTTIIAPAGMGDIVLVEGLPVGGVFSFFWNLMISASFQFVGFMLTYLLHTSHAAKQGSRAGLGVFLVQTGFYVRSRGTLEDDEYYYNGDGSSSSNGKIDDTDADIVSYFFMILGWFIIIRALADYFRAKQMEKIICAEPNTASTPEEMV